MLRCWAEAPGVKALVIENRSHADLLHRRTILFIDDAWFLIHDEAVGGAAGEVAIHFQLVPCPIIERDNRVATRFETGPNLTVRNFPVGTVPRRQVEEGWISYEILKRQERPAWKWAIAKTAAQPKTEFLTALVPDAGPAPAGPDDARVRAVADGAVYEVACAGVAYEVTLRPAKSEVVLRRR